MRNARVWQRLLGLVRAVIERIDMETDEAGELLVVAARPRKGARRRCGRCGARSPWYDRGPGRRRWRHLDFGTVRVMLGAAVPRVNCARHGPTVVAVPWARHASRFTVAFEDTAAWLVARAAASTVSQLLRISWRAVTGIVARVVAEAAGRVDRLDGLRRIGIDEVAYRKGQRYLQVTWNQPMGWLPGSARYGGSAWLVLPGDGARGEVAGAGPARAGGRVAAGVG